MYIDYKQVGMRMKQSRCRRKMTQEQLAEKLGVSVGYVSQVERGKTKISLDLLAAVATHLECGISFLVDGTGTFETHYLESELYDLFKDLSPERRKLLLRIAQIISEQ